MPVLSLPLPIGGMLSPICFPIRIPFPMLRISSILPFSLNGPLKDSLMALFKLAWSNKLQLPVLITVCFLVMDIRLQLEINIFWEPPRINRQRDRGDRVVSAQRNNDGVHPALVAATLVHRERQRIRLQERARQLRRDLAELRDTGRYNNYSSTRTEIYDVQDTDTETDLGNSQEHDSTDQQIPSPSSRTFTKAARAKRKKLRKKHLKIKSNSTLVGTELSEDTEDESTEDEDSSNDTDTEFSSDDETDDDENDSAARLGDPDVGDYNEDHDFRDGQDSNDSNDSDDDDTGTPLVVELEIRQRPVFQGITTNKFPSTVLKTGIGVAKLFKYEIVPVLGIVSPSSKGRQLC